MNQQGGGPPGRRGGTAVMQQAPPAPPAGGYGQPPPQPTYDAAMMPRQVDAPNLEGWNPGDLNARGALAWVAIVLCGWMALVRIGEGGLALVLTQQAHASGGALAGGGIFSFIAAAFYVWAAIGLYNQKQSAYRWVIRVNALLAVLGVVQIALSVMNGGGLAMGITAAIQIIGTAFHVLALGITYAARDNVGGRSEWSS